MARKDVLELRRKISSADPDTLDLLLRQARTHYGWQTREVPDSLLRDVYDLAKFGPTSMNQQPARFVFVRSEAAKQKLLPALAEANRQKMLSAPVTAIIAYDLAFFDNLPKVFPPNPNARGMFAGNEAMASANAVRNGTLQAAYFMIAARAYGLDVGAMSGFDAMAVDAAFFSGRSIRTNFLCNLGYGDEEKLFRRLPRLDFEEVAEIA
ncbi:MAG: malonic semialdehyde reductase [Rhodospirillales bacterium]|nr:malonic semialdehyde reductase [Rhodospirillales bacterium]